MKTLTDRFFTLLLEEKDTEAIEVLRQSPDTSESRGLRGYALYCGIEERDKDRAFVCFDIAAADADSLSLYYLGIMCENGEIPGMRTGTGKYGRADAETFMKRCADGGGVMESSACLWLGRRAMRSADTETALTYLKRAAATDDEESIGLLAQCCTERAEERNFADAVANAEMFRWQERAYELNPHDESYRYGRLLYGDVAGIPSNLRLALKLYEEDYEFGHSQGARALAMHYEREAAMAQDAEHAATFTSLAKRWHEHADNNVENDYEPEQIIEED